MASSLTLKDLLAFAPADYTDSANAWAGWAKSANDSGKSLDEVHFSLKENWSGSAAFAAQDKIQGDSLAVKASASIITEIENNLRSAAKTMGGYKSQAATLVGEIQKDAYLTLDEGSCTVTAKAAPKNAPKNWGVVGGATAASRASAYQSKLRGILSKAQAADSGIANEIDGLMPPKDGAPPPSLASNGNGPGNPGTSGPGTTGGGSFAPPPTTKPPGNVNDWIQQAIKILEANGVPASELNAQDIWTIIQHESGGNPNSINLWDSNAAAGHPSMGLMQTIQSTFNAHMLPGHGNVYNPVDNIIAGVRYAISRYGSVQNVPGIVSMSHGGAYVGY